ncbi:MAG: hypothetical protein HKO57_17270 [Akkermansiaceae bacterium]|nr:hypothetical protein [Akkermansiaceae bacterium]
MAGRDSQSPPKGWSVAGRRRGFALVVTVSILVLLAVISVGLLTLSTLTVRGASQGDAQAEAQANARLALVLALGELQEEMGPDMRVSAEAAIFDQDPDSAEIDGVAQSRWLASYHSWGTWLNAAYTPPDGGSTLQIQDTYTAGRKPMFRRWLVSLPDDMSGDVDAPLRATGLDDANSVVLVGKGTLGAAAQSHPDRVTRAHLTPVNKTGRQAWWIGPENHKARVDKARQPRELTVDHWEASQGDTADVGVGLLPGLGALESDGTLSDKLATLPTLRPAGIDAEVVGQHFFDLTASSRGVLASVRTGHLKKDLSLLFEQEKAELPEPYRFDSDDVREPSIRPMSPEIADKPVLRERHFASWNRMRHFYRMYRRDSDAEARAFDDGGTDGSPGLRWAGSKPWTDCNVSTYFSAWDGQDTYVRFPILTNITYILSLKTDPGNTRGTYDLRYVASPVYVYWNPYNVELRVPDVAMTTRTYLAQVHPLVGRFFTGRTHKKDVVLRFDDDYARMMSGNGRDIVFRPGEFRIFTPEPGNIIRGNLLDMLPGFDPQSYGGLYATVGSYTPDQRPRFAMRFGHETNRWLFNMQFGNTPASFVSFRYWTPTGDYRPRSYLPFHHHVDWFNTAQTSTFITPPAAPDPWVFDGDLLPVGYFQLVLKGIHDHDYATIGWEQDWRCRNWIQAPPFYLGKGLYMSEDETIGNTQRIDCPYELRFGPLLGAGRDVDDIIQHVGHSAIMGIDERVTAVPSLELPTAPVASLAGFAAMRINPGWVDIATLNPDWKRPTAPRGETRTAGFSQHVAESKAWAYQSGITGPGIGNSFLHPVIPRTDVYRFLNNSISMDLNDCLNINAGYTKTDTKAYCDYWDHVLLLNDALWDDYFVSSLADQTRPGATAGTSLAENIRKLANGEELANTRYVPYGGGRSAEDVVAELDGADGYLKAAAHLMVDGMFNVNSTSVAAWQALFSGIRERRVVYRDKNGTLRPVEIPEGKRIALSRFNTATTDQEGTDPEFGIARDDGMQAWSGVRFLDDDQLRKLARECVKQVKRRGPFLNFSEFINRRLSDDELGTMGALQSAIDYDDASPEAGSINHSFKSHGDFMLEEGDLGDHAFATPEAAIGSRFAGIPGYVIQSDLLKPIANTLSVRDDTFRIRAYGESLDHNGRVLARAWCEAIVQRVPEYADGANPPEIPARKLDSNGEFSSVDDGELTPVNRRFGRKFQIESFRWLRESEI